MFISTAMAQTAAGGAGGLGPIFEGILPLILIFVVFYFLLIRPQQKKMKTHKEMLLAARRGDKIVTGGGIIGTITKVDDEQQVTVEIAKDVKVKIRRDSISQVLSKTEPVSNDNKADGDADEKPAAKVKRARKTKKADKADKADKE